MEKYATIVEEKGTMPETAGSQKPKERAKEITKAKAKESIKEKAKAKETSKAKVRVTGDPKDQKEFPEDRSMEVAGTAGETTSAETAPVVRKAEEMET